MYVHKGPEGRGVSWKATPETLVLLLVRLRWQEERWSVIFCSAAVWPHCTSTWRQLHELKLSCARQKAVNLPVAALFAFTETRVMG